MQIIWFQISVDCSPEPFPLQSVTAREDASGGPPPERLEVWADLVLVAPWADAVGKLHGGVRGDVLFHRLPGVRLIADTLAVATNRQHPLQLPDLRERPTQLGVHDAQGFFTLGLLREIPHEHAGPLLSTAVGVDGGREGRRKLTAVLAPQREDPLKAARRQPLGQRLTDPWVRQVHDRAAAQRAKLVERVAEEPAGGRIGIEDRPVLWARQKGRIETMLQQLGVDGFRGARHPRALHFRASRSSSRSRRLGGSPSRPRRAPDTPTAGLRLLSATEQAPYCGDDALSRRSGSTSSVRRGQPRHARRRFRWQQDKDDKVADYGRPR